MSVMTDQSAPPAPQLDNLVWRFVQEGKTRQALAACSDLNRLHPAYAPGWHTASQLAQRMNNRGAALQAIERAVALEPENPEWLLQKSYCLMQQGDTGSARPLVEKLVGVKLSNAYQYATLALLLSRLELQKEAAEKYQRAIELEPERGSHHYNLATVQRFLGQMDAADASLARALKLDPKDHEAHRLRADLRRQTPDNNHVDTLRSILDTGLDDPRAEVNIRQALAKELEDLELYPESFASLKQSADLRRRMMRYQVSGDLETMSQIAGQFDTDWLASGSDGHDTSEPIFVLGMPRTGTTLVERILGNHSHVRSAGELNNFAMEMTRLARAGLPPDHKPDKQELVSLAAKLDSAELGRSYLESTRPLSGATPHFIDKMPLNFLYVGLIHRALPKAKIVHLQRDPMDTCYAIYKTGFKDAYPFSYQLEELGQYYLAYRKLMAHWQELLPGAIHEVAYEDLVSDTEPQVRAMLDYCELPWEKTCLAFQDNQAPSTTASASQVREGIYTSSVGKWRHYAEELRPLVEILRAGGVELDV